MTLNSQGRPTAPANYSEASKPGYSEAGTTPILQSKGLLQGEGLIFEIGDVSESGVDFEKLRGRDLKLGDMARTSDIDLPGLSEPEAMRHYMRLSQRNYAIDLGLFPLGSCTMKHNPRANEKMARLSGFADIHPLQPQASIQGALELMEELADWLVKLTGMSAVALTPKAGAHGEFCGMLAIKAALKAKGELNKRNKVLVPESAHGTNPATAVACGFDVVEIAADDRGRVHLADLKATLTSDIANEIAGIMLTNPNTCGLFETDIVEIADLVHKAGGYFYCDGANFNAIMGQVKPGDLGIDAMHINLHKTFSTPHGGGGPGAGPVVLSEALAPFAPVPFLKREGDRLSLIEHEENTDAFGRMCVFHGQMGMYVRALSYMLAHGADGIKQASEDAVLNANYLLARLKDKMSPAFEGSVMHEVLLSDSSLEGTGIDTIDIAKGLIDEGYHPMTMYFPLVVSGAMLIEPTETESKAELDRFAEALLRVHDKAIGGGESAEELHHAPHFAPVKRLDETQAARKPVLKYNG